MTHVTRITAFDVHFVTLCCVAEGWKTGFACGRARSVSPLGTSRSAEHCLHPLQP